MTGTGNLILVKDLFDAGEEILLHCLGRPGPGNRPNSDNGMGGSPLPYPLTTVLMQSRGACPTRDRVRATLQARPTNEDRIR